MSYLCAIAGKIHVATNVYPTHKTQCYKNIMQRIYTDQCVADHTYCHWCGNSFNAVYINWCRRIILRRLDNCEELFLIHYQNDGMVTADKARGIHYLTLSSYNVALRDILSNRVVCPKYPEYNWVVMLQTLKRAFIWRLLCIIAAISNRDVGGVIMRFYIRAITD